MSEIPAEKLAVTLLVLAIAAPAAAVAALLTVAVEAEPITTLLASVTKAAVSSATVPVTVWALLTVTLPVVALPTALRSAAVRVASVSVTASLPRPEMPDAPVELKAVVRSAKEPVKVVTVPALIWPLVLPSRLLRSAAASVVSESVTASLPRPAIPDAPVELKAVVRSAVEPVRVVTVPALIWPLVFASRVLRSAAASVTSESVTASLPRPAIPVAPVEL